jgi:hypothetical protein
VSSTDVWAVGYTFNGSVSNSQSRTLTLHWNGAAWSVVPSPNTSNPENQLLGVVAIAANDVWAVGHWYDYSVFRTLIMHWNGATWSIVPSPNPGASANFLYSVEAVAANDVWAVGTQQDTLEQTLAIHWNGATWTVADTPQIGPFGNNMLEVSAVSANDIWAVGFHLEVFGFDQPYQTSAFHYDGTSWAAVPPLNVNQEPNYLFDVVALAANDVWAVGFYDTGTALKTMIQHWDGTGWSFIPSPSPGDHADELIAIDAASATDLWAVGRTAGTFFGAGTLVEHFGPACPTNTPGPTVTATPTRTPTATPNGATPTPRRTATVTPTVPAAAMHVADIAPSFSARLGSFQVRAVITIQNTGNVAVPAASVTVNITQPNGAVVTQTRTTNTNGSATFTITSSQTGTYTFTVTNVAKAGLAYNAAANVETSDSISVQ